MSKPETSRRREVLSPSAPELRTVGPLARGVFWEVIGVMELSNHCRRLSVQLANELAERPATHAMLSG
jgi:uncharacterized NAD(P)/FAD-binding protein YdhS